MFPLEKTWGHGTSKFFVENMISAIKRIQCGAQKCEWYQTILSIFWTILYTAYVKGIMVCFQTTNSVRKPFGINWIDDIAYKVIKSVRIRKCMLRSCILVNYFKIWHCTVSSINGQVLKDFPAFFISFYTILQYPIITIGIRRVRRKEALLYCYKIKINYTKWRKKVEISINV